MTLGAWVHFTLRVSREAFGISFRLPVNEPNLRNSNRRQGGWQYNATNLRRRTRLFGGHGFG